MSINTTDPNLNPNQQPAITNQPQAHQMSHNYNNNKHLNYQTAPYQQQQQTVGNVQSTVGNQMTNLSSGLSSGQLAVVAAGKKAGQPGTQFKSNQQQQLKAGGQTNTNNNNNQSPRYRKVFIQRDYSEGTSVRFQNKFPEELEGYIERQHFDYLITTLNCYYDKAEAGNLSTFCEGFCACLTAYLIYVCMESHYEKYMRKTRDYINEQNEKVWRPRGLYVTDPIDRGLRILEITIGPKAQQRDMVSSQFKQRDG